MSDSSRLGRNPLFRKRASAVSKILERDAAPIEASGDEAEASNETRWDSLDFLDRVRKMDIEMNFGVLARHLYGRLRRRQV